VLRQQLRDLEGVGLRADRLEGAADLEGGVGLHVPEVHVRRTAEIEDHDARPRLVAGANLPFGGGAGVLRKREADGGKRPHVQEIPAARAAAAEEGALTGPANLKLEHPRCLQWVDEWKG
jgi:hypothetical protein